MTLPATNDDAAVELEPTVVLEAFQRRVRSDPEAVFLSTLDGTSWTYEQVGNAVDRVSTVIDDSPRSPIIGAYGGNEPLSIVALPGDLEVRPVPGMLRAPAASRSCMAPLRDGGVRTQYFLARDVQPFEGALGVRAVLRTRPRNERTGPARAPATCSKSSHHDQPR